MLLTRSRLCPRASPGSSLHLHVLSTPPAFVLSQDQTLREELLGASPKAHTRHVELSWIVVRRRVHRGAAIYDGSILRSAEPGCGSADRTWTHTGSGFDPSAHAVEFSKTAAPCREGDSFSRDATGRTRRPARTAQYSAPSAIPPRGLDVGAGPSSRGTVAHLRTEPGPRRSARAAVVEVEQDDLLPGPQAELAADDRDRLARAR